MTTAAAASPSEIGTVLDDNPEVTRSYSEALINAAEKEGQVDVVLDEIDEITSQVLPAHPALASLLTSPLVSPADKDRILVEIFSDRALPTVARFLRVLN